MSRHLNIRGMVTPSLPDTAATLKFVASYIVLLSLGYGHNVSSEKYDLRVWGP
jgi:hypothetical protein